MRDGSRHTSRLHWFAQIGSISVGLFLLYVLSTGPVCWLAQKMPASVPAVRQFYYPLVWLDNNTSLGAPLEAYLNLWDAH